MSLTVAGLVPVVAAELEAVSKSAGRRKLSTPKSILRLPDLRSGKIRGSQQSFLP